MVNIGTLDLNRLLVLHAVLEERSVTKAAARLHVTPSAISNALATLRDTFGDPLVVRSGRGLAVTPRAATLAPRLADAINNLVGVVEERAFDPMQTTRTFALACSDAQQISEVPRIVARFEERLPCAHLHILSVEQFEAAGGLSSPHVDAAIGPASHVPQTGMHASDLYEEEGVMLVRKDHPRVRRKKLTKEQFNSLRHVDILIALGGGGVGHRIVDEFFGRHGLRRDIAVSVSSFAAAAAVAARTELVAGMPNRLAEVYVKQLPLKIVELPIPPLVFRMQLQWHARTHDDPASQFFRSLVVSALRTTPSRDR